MYFSGTIQAGFGRGRKIGFPTINIQLQRRNAPWRAPEGVFAVRGKINGCDFEGVAHFGPRPTFGEEKASVEIHVFGFDRITDTLCQLSSDKHGNGHACPEWNRRIDVSIIDGKNVGPLQYNGLKVEFKTVGEKIREVRKFESMEELRKQIERDCNKARNILIVEM